MKLSIIIPVLNKFAFTKAILEDLSKLPVEDYEIIVADNNSSDETQNLKSICKLSNLIHHRFSTNLGFGTSCNAAYAISSGENILFLNNDVKLRDKEQETTWPSILAEYCFTSLVGPTMGVLDESLNFVKEHNNYIDSKYSYMSGWCLASSRENFEKIAWKPGKPFCEDFFVFFEDTDLSFRARQLNLPFKIVKIPLVHFKHQTAKSMDITKMYTDSQKIFKAKWSGKC